MLSGLGQVVQGFQLPSINITKLSVIIDKLDGFAGFGIATVQNTFKMRQGANNLTKM
jgi:hypothetical protein